MYSGKDIKDLREKLGFQQTELAEELNTTVHTIRHWEQNPDVSIKAKYEPTIEKLLDTNIYDGNVSLVVDGIKEKIKQNLLRIASILHPVATLYFCATDSDVPFGKKAIAFAALTYFIMPIDAIPDALPVAGFTDDIAMITGAIASLGSVITQDHKEQADEWLNNL